MSKRGVLVLVVAVAIIAAAAAVTSVVLIRGSTPAPGPRAAAAASPSATPLPSGSPITRAQAAKQYLAIVADSNTVQVRCSKVVKAFEAELTDEAFARLKRCYRQVTDTFIEMAKQLRAAAWPAEVKGDIEKLARFTDAQAYAFQRGSKLRTIDEYWTAEAPEDDGSADIVRARLGLPTRDG